MRSTEGSATHQKPRLTQNHNCCPYKVPRRLGIPQGPSNGALVHTPRKRYHTHNGNQKTKNERVGRPNTKGQERTRKRNLRAAGCGSRTSKKAKKAQQVDENKLVINNQIKKASPPSFVDRDPYYQHPKEPFHPHALIPERTMCPQANPAHWDTNRTRPATAQGSYRPPHLRHFRTAAQNHARRILVRNSDQECSEEPMCL